MLPNPSRCAFIGGVSSGKTNALLCTLGNCHAWKAFEHVYLMSPNNETTRSGEYGLLDDVTCLDHFPTLDYFAKRPGRSALIIDDLSWALSKKGTPSQHELADCIWVRVEPPRGRPEHLHSAADPHRHPAEHPTARVALVSAQGSVRYVVFENGLKAISLSCRPHLTSTLPNGVPDVPCTYFFIFKIKCEDRRESR